MEGSIGSQRLEEGAQLANRAQMPDPYQEEGRRARSQKAGGSAGTDPGTPVLWYEGPP
jgi:hypothetical protein